MTHDELNEIETRAIARPTSTMHTVLALVAEVRRLRVELERQRREVLHLIEDADYAMVGGNLDERPVPCAIITSWLDTMRRVLAAAQ